MTAYLRPRRETEPTRFPPPLRERMESQTAAQCRITIPATEIDFTFRSCSTEGTYRFRHWLGIRKAKSGFVARELP
jgi:hypothetical protein